MRILYLISLLAVSASLISSCQFIRVDRANFSPQLPLRYQLTTELVFTPGTKETFILREKPEGMQAAGYARFCANTYRATCRNRLPYLRYVGMKGYFDQAGPVKTDNQHYEYYPVVLENGHKFFFLSLKQQGGKYGQGSPISLLAMNTDYAKRPIIQGSKVSIIGEYQSFNQHYYHLSNDRVLESFKLAHIRAISEKYQRAEQIADLLLEVQIEYNEDYGAYLIQANKAEQAIDTRLIIGLNAQGSWIRLKVSHVSDGAMSVNRYSIVADNLQWQSPLLPFERATDGPRVSDSFEILANDQELSIVASLATASQAEIRLHDDSESISLLLQPRQKQQLANILKLYKLLKGAPNLTVKQVLSSVN